MIYIGGISIWPILAQLETKADNQKIVSILRHAESEQAPRVGGDYDEDLQRWAGQGSISCLENIDCVRSVDVFARTGNTRSYEYAKFFVIDELIAYHAGMERSFANQSFLLKALGVMYATLCIHPLTDRNGRLSRLMFSRSLEASTGYTNCAIDPGQVMKNNDAMITAYRDIATNMDPRALVAIYEGLIVDIYRRLPTKFCLSR